MLRFARNDEREGFSHTSFGEGEGLVADLTGNSVAIDSWLESYYCNRLKLIYTTSPPSHSMGEGWYGGGHRFIEANWTMY